MPPGPSGLTAIRSLLRIANDPLAGAAALMAEYGDAVRVPVIPSRDFMLLTRSQHVEHVLVTRADNYIKGAAYAPFREFLGDGLGTSDGALWEYQRRLIQPLFSHRRMVALVPTMVERAQALVQEWEALPDGAIVDVSQATRRLTLDILGEALFGATLALHPLIDAVAVLQDFAARAMLNPLLLGALFGVARPGLRTTPGYRQLMRAMTTIDDVIADLVSRRRAALGTPWLHEPSNPDLLDTLLTSSGKDGAGISDRQIRDEILTFLIGGHETSATLLDWALLALSAHPPIRRSLEKEVDEVLGGGVPNATDIHEHFVFTRAVVSEVLRLYPPLWTMQREAVADDVVGDLRVAAGTTVAIPPYLVHRHPTAWDSPEGFDPSRFLPGNASERHRYAWIPFGGGRRGCVGKGFAMSETVIALVLLTQRFRLDLPPGARQQPLGALNLRPRFDLHMVLKRR